MRAFWCGLLWLLCCSVAGAASDRDGVCLNCHDEMEAKPILSIYQSRHGQKADSRTPACQDCHGESAAHSRKERPKGQPRPHSEVPFVRLAKPDPQAAQKESQMCLSCHSGQKQRHWLGSRHEGAGLSCVSCHSSHEPHDPVLQRTSQSSVCFQCHGAQRIQLHQRSAHPVSKGSMACSDCHNPHGSTGPKLLVGDTVNETCYTCHAEKRGPFLWSHAPVDEECSLCHTPHGSPHAALLKQRQLWLCQDCHASRLHPSKAYSASTGTAASVGASVNSNAQMALHACANCHPQVHGSNHPAGRMLVR